MRSPEGGLANGRSVLFSAPGFVHPFRVFLILKWFYICLWLFMLFGIIEHDIQIDRLLTPAMPRSDANLCGARSQALRESLLAPAILRRRVLGSSEAQFDVGCFMTLQRTIFQCQTFILIVGFTVNMCCPFWGQSYNCDDDFFGWFETTYSYQSWSATIRPCPGLCRTSNRREAFTWINIDESSLRRCGKNSFGG